MPPARYTVITQIATRISHTSRDSMSGRSPVNQSTNSLRYAQHAGRNVSPNMMNGKNNETFAPKHNPSAPVLVSSWSNIPHQRPFPPSRYASYTSTER
ncbi:hypothetical protein, variant [Blastomyces dermatitidis ATCC 26199]|nr:hypothetical protein, variant [Blastomyces dermatitidis ATCC 26199]